MSAFCVCVQKMFLCSWPLHSGSVRSYLYSLFSEAFVSILDDILARHDLQINENVIKSS